MIRVRLPSSKSDIYFLEAKQTKPQEAVNSGQKTATSKPTAPVVSSGAKTTVKREYDRQSGTGRGKEIRKGGAGGGFNWGSNEEAIKDGVESFKTNTNPKPVVEEKAADNGHATPTETATAQATPDAASQAVVEPTPEVVVRTLDDFKKEQTTSHESDPNFQAIHARAIDTEFKGLTPIAPKQHDSHSSSSKRPKAAKTDDLTSQAGFTFEDRGRGGRGRGEGGRFEKRGGRFEGRGGGRGGGGRPIAWNSKEAFPSL